MVMKNRIGRPRLPEDQKRVELIRICMSKEEKINFKKVFKESLYPTYRAFVLAKISPAANVLTPGELDLLRECSLAVQAILEQYKKIGNNFNQLLRLAQTEKKIPEQPALQHIVEEFKRLTTVTAPLMHLVNTMNEQWLLK